MTGELALAERPQFDDLQPTDKRISEPGAREQAGRTGENEPTWPAVAVDSGLHGTEQSGRELDLVNDEWCGSMLEKAARIGVGGLALGQIVQRDELAAGHIENMACQGALADLSGTVDGDHRCVLERSEQVRQCRSPNVVPASHRGDCNSPHERPAESSILCLLICR